MEGEKLFAKVLEEFREKQIFGDICCWLVGKKTLIKFERNSVFSTPSFDLGWDFDHILHKSCFLIVHL